jgi:hypothetical protein
MTPEQCSAASVLCHTSMPPQGFRCAVNFYKKLYICMLYLEKGKISSFVITIHNTPSRMHAHAHMHTDTHTKVHR